MNTTRKSSSNLLDFVETSLISMLMGDVGYYGPAYVEAHTLLERHLIDDYSIELKGRY
jgi:hypothetical protein